MNHTIWDCYWKVKGLISYDDLLIVDGIQYSSFKVVAQKRGLLEFDNSIIECLDEASTFQMSYAFRKLFATLLAHFEPTEVKKIMGYILWNSVRRLHKIGWHYCRISNPAYFEWFASVSRDHRKNISAYDLQAIKSNSFEVSSRSTKEILDEESINVSKEDIDIVSKLNR